MTAAQYIASFLASRGITDAFGIPGGVILELLYAMDSMEGITPHLCYHEQAAGFAANGFAQCSGTPGVAYATKGPGFTNLVTAIADAYFDSSPVIYLTAHSADLPRETRCKEEQDLDTCAMVAKVTKYARRVETMTALAEALQEAYRMATEGRKGPVLLDIKASVLKEEFPERVTVSQEADVSTKTAEQLAGTLRTIIRNAARPVLLVGDGVNQSCTTGSLNRFIAAAGIPVLSSRYSHNVAEDADFYFGYVGSHGIRYANFILSKADVAICLGNRLAFPASSQSFCHVTEKCRFVRIDTDEAELHTHPAMTDCYHMRLEHLLPALSTSQEPCGEHTEWMQVCRTLRSELQFEDAPEIVHRLGKLLKVVPADNTLVCDVGNNEFFVSRACVLSATRVRALYSKSFGALGNALGKSIGAYYATRRPVIAIVGDQGFQLNVQELQYIAQHQLPISIVLLNNHASGMIRDREHISKRGYFLHTTQADGYGHPDFKTLAEAYRIPYLRYAEADADAFARIFPDSRTPLLLEMELRDDAPLTPTLPRGCVCQDLFPHLSREKYTFLNHL